MRPLEQTLEISTKPWHLMLAAAIFVLGVYALVSMPPAHFQALVSVYIAWRVARWVLLNKPTR